ncbi:unnamed protein product [Protopolystoma xenopodis]|uniref:Anaphase-promoting complex subunit 2 TPR repeats domain-containing protein n=1 Tax=Protopolystoma xenopodis TaxID=117903 RepID=A0A3S5A2W3_9PLAT|nr:unnamed protein product [Protopolystoma xenopodis]
MSANLAPSSFFCPDYQNDLLDAYSVFLYSNDFASCFDHVSHMCEEFLDDTLSQTVLRCMSYGDSRFSNCLRTFFESLGKAIQVVAEAHNVIFHQLPINDALRSDISSITLAILFPLNIYGNLRPVINALMYLFLESSERTSSSLLSIKTYELPDAQCRAALLNQYEGLLGNKSGLLNISHLFDDRWLSFAKYILCARLEKFCSGRPTDGLLHHALDYKNRVLLLLWLPNLFHNQATLKANKDLLKDDMVYDAFYKIRKRLLHPGVHTEQLLLAYACLVRALRLVDPTFVIQEVVCRPLVTCLRKREDAVRCIVDELINNPSTRKNSEVAFLSCDRGGVELHRELMLPIPLEIEPLRDDNDESDTDMIAEDPNSDEFRRLTSDFEARFHSKVTSDNLHSKHEISLPKYKASCCSDSSESIFPSTFKQSNCYHLLQQSGSQLWASWQPDPIEARLQTGLRRNQLDLLSMLVSIYGSRRAFLVEYKQLLGQRLLQRQARASRVLTDACTPKWDTMDISVFDTSAEGTNLELLKLRFGESNLHECEVCEAVN